MPIEVFSRIRDGSLNVVNENHNLCNVKFKGKTDDNKFTINKIWREKTSNELIFNDLVERSKNFNECYWCSFGYTGSGKTYTTNGILKLLLEYYLKKPISVEFSAFQIYNEKVYDMMANNSQLKI
mgnify:FL=1